MGEPDTNDVNMGQQKEEWKGFIKNSKCTFIYKLDII